MLGRKILKVQQCSQKTGAFIQGLERSLRVGVRIEGVTSTCRNMSSHLHKIIHVDWYVSVHEWLFFWV